MAEFQPPEGLREDLARRLAARYGEAEVFTDGDPCDEWRRDQYRSDAGHALAALFEAGEVREERRIVIDDERASGLPVNGLWITPPVMVGTHHFLLGRYPDARVERRFVIETEPEPVSSTGEEPTDG